MNVVNVTQIMIFYPPYKFACYGYPGMHGADVHGAHCALRLTKKDK